MFAILCLPESALGHDAVYQCDSAYINVTFSRFKRLLVPVHQSCFKDTLMSGKVNDEPFQHGTISEFAALSSNVSPWCKITCFILPLSLRNSSVALTEAQLQKQMISLSEQSSTII